MALLSRRSIALVLVFGTAGYLRQFRDFFQGPSTSGVFFVDAAAPQTAAGASKPEVGEKTFQPTSGSAGAPTPQQNPGAPTPEEEFATMMDHVFRRPRGRGREQYWMAEVEVVKKTSAGVVNSMYMKGNASQVDHPSWVEATRDRLWQHFHKNGTLPVVAAEHLGEIEMEPGSAWLGPLEEVGALQEWQDECYDAYCDVRRKEFRLVSLSAGAPGLIREPAAAAAGEQAA
eukprot:g16879.t1